MLPMSQVSRSVKRLRERYASFGQGRRRKTRPACSSARRARSLRLEPLEPRMLLSTADPFDPTSNPNGYMDLGGDLRFMLKFENSTWVQGSTPAIWQVNADAVWVGAVPDGGASYVPLLEFFGDVAVNRTDAEFMVGVTNENLANVYYAPQGQDVSFKRELFELKQNTPWIEAKEVVGPDGVTIDASIVDTADTDGVAVAPKRGILFPGQFRIDNTDPLDPLLVMKGDLSIQVPKFLRVPGVRYLLDDLHLNFGTDTVYSVAADKNKLVQIESKDVQSGYWASMATNPFKWGDFDCQVQQLLVNYEPDQDKLSIVGDAMMSIRADSGQGFALYLELGTSRDDPGLIIQGTDSGWEVTQFGGSIGINKHGSNENSEMSAAGSKFTITDAGFSFDRTDETLKIFGDVSWAFGEQNALNVSLGTQSEPGLVLRDGELAYFDAQVTTGTIKVKSLDIELDAVEFVFARYSYGGGSEVSSPYDGPLLSAGAMSITEIADQFYHPKDTTGAVDVDVSGAAQGSTVTVTATSSDHSFLTDAMLMVTPTADPNVFTLAIDADPNTTGNQAPNNGGTAAITLTASGGQNTTTTTFDFTVGDEQITFSGDALLSIGSGAQFKIGVLKDSPWTWTDQGGNWDWDIGSLVIGLNGQLGLGPIKVEAKDLQITYTNSADGDEWTVGGSASIPILFHAEVGFGSASNPGLKIKNGDWEVTDLYFSLSAAHIGAFGLEQLQMHYSHPQGGDVTLDFGGAVSFPGGFSVGAGFDIVNGELRMIRVDYDAGRSEGIPIGDTGVFITGMAAEIDDLGDPDVKVSGDIGFSTGPSEEIDGKRRGFLTGEGSFWVDRHGMEIDVDVDFEGGVAGSGSAKLILDWQAQDYRASVSVSLIGGAVTLDASAELKPHEFILGAKADVSVPNSVPIIGGMDLIQVDCLLYLSQDDKFVAAWTYLDSLHIWAGAEYDFTDHKFSLIGKKTIKKLEGEVPDQDNHPYVEAQAFDVPATANGASFEATWAQYDDSLKILVLPPNWAVPVQITSDMENHTIGGQPGQVGNYVVSVIADRTAPTSLAFVVRPTTWSPTDQVHQLTPPGRWNVAVVSDNEVWPDIEGSYLQPPPTLSLDVAGTGRNTANVTYSWQSADPDHSKLTLYYDDDAFGYDGRPFATITPFTKPSGYAYFERVTSQYTWDPESLEALQHVPYYVYGILDDGTGVPVYAAYSAHAVTPQPPLLVRTNVNRGEDADKSGWTVKVLDENGTLVNTVDGVPCSRQTNGLGEVAFNIAAGTYTVLMTRMTSLYVPQPGSGQNADDNGNIAQTVVISSPNTQTVSPVFTFSKRSEISGRVFVDSNANGLRDPADLPLEAWQVFIDANGNGQLDDGEPVDSTNHDGVYALYVDPPAVGDVVTWQVRQQDPPADYEMISPSGGLYRVALSTAPDGASPSSFGRDFLNSQVVAVTGMVFDDANGNGVQDSGEPGISGLVVSLTPKGGSPLTATTDAQGRYVIKTELAAGGTDYTITVERPSGATETWPVSDLFDFGSHTSFADPSPLEPVIVNPAYDTLLVGDFTAASNGTPDGSDDIFRITGHGAGATSYQYAWNATQGRYTAIGPYGQTNLLFPQYQFVRLDPDHPDLLLVDNKGELTVWRWEKDDPDGPDGDLVWNDLNWYTPVPTGANARFAILDLDDDGDLDVFVNDGYGWMNDGSANLTRTATSIMPPPLIPPATGALLLPGAGSFFGTSRAQDLAMAYADGNGNLIVSTYKKSAPDVVSYGHVQDFILPGRTPLRMVVGDLDGDGDSDIVLAGATGEVVTVDILMNDGGRLELADSFEFQAEDNLGSMSLADVDGNGYQDVLWSFPGSVNVLLNHGRNYFTLSQRSDYLPSGASELPGDYPRVAAAHVAGRSTPLIVVQYIVYGPSIGKSSDEAYMTVYAPVITSEYEYDTRLAEVGTHSGYDFGLHGAAVPPQAQLAGTVFEDLDGNGIQDLGEDGVAGVEVQLVRASDGSIAATATADDVGAYVFSAPSAGNYRIQLADASHQAFPFADDLAFGPQTSHSAITDPVAWAAEDFNGDGLTDYVLVQNEHLVTRLSSLSGAEQQVVSAVEPIHPIDGELSNVAYFIQVGDLDNDGTADLVVTSGEVHEGTWMMTLHGNGDGTFTMAQHAQATALGIPVVQALADPRLADLNGDGRLDLVWFGHPTVDSHVHVLLNAGDGTFSPGATSLVSAYSGWPTVTPSVADLNADGEPDVIIIDPSDTKLHLYRGYGRGRFALYASVTPIGTVGGTEMLNANNDGAIRIADLDGDGLPDLIVGTAKAVEVFWNEGGFRFTAETLVTAANLPSGSSSLTSIAVAVADLTGDGLDDVAVIYASGAPTQTHMTALINEGGGRFSGPIAAIAAPTPSYLATFAAEDLNGDGLAELVFAPLSQAGKGHSLAVDTWTNAYVAQKNYAITYTAGANLGGYDFGVVPPASDLSEIRGAAFQDLDSDALWEGNEAGIFGLSVYADLNDNGEHDAGEPTDETDLLGSFRLAGLAAGRYDVRALVPSDYTQTTPNPPTVQTTAGEVVPGVLFGLHPEFPVNAPPVAGFGYAAALDGVNDGVEIGAAPFNGLAAWTLSAWINPSELKYGMIYSEGTPNETLAIAIEGNGAVYVHTWNHDTSGNWIGFSTPAGVIAEDQWSFVAVRLSNGGAGTGNITVFVNDGKYTGSLQAEDNSNAKFAVIGANVGGLESGQGVDAFPGLIDEVRLWTVALSDADVRARQFLPLAGDEHGLTAWYRFDEATGVIATNASAADADDKANGALANGASWTPSGAITRTYAVEGRAVTGTLFGNDPNGDSLHFVLGDEAAHGNVAINPTTAAFTYTPTDPTWNGTDSFTFFASDGGSWSALPYTAQIVVRSSNQPPIVADDDVQVPYSNSPIHVLDNDSDWHDGAPGENNLPLTIYDYTQGQQGSVTLGADGQTLIYRTSHLYSLDTFKYRAVDSLGGVSDWATVNLRVVPPTVDDTLATDENTLATINVLRNDMEASGNHSLTVSGLDSSATIGLVCWSADGSVAYDPHGGFEYLAVGETAVDSFRYTVDDGQGGAFRATVTLVVSGANDPPTAAIVGPAAAVEGTPVSLTASATDVDSSDVLVYQWTVGKDGAAFAAGAGPDIGFTPDDDGTYTVQVTVSDGHGGETVATHEVQVSNAPPVVSITGPATGIRGESLAYESQIQDPGAADTHALQWTATAASGAMVATGTEASFSFTPWQIGVYTVALTVTDEDGAADTDVQTVTVAWWALSPSATDPSQSVLTIVGSDGPDRINVTGKRGRYTVSILEYNTDLHERHDIAAALSKIVVFGSAGNDAIDVDADVSAELYGDGGDDRLYGGRGDDLLVGGVGNDWLWGRDGNDCLDGGSGNDWLFGGRGDDTLVGGSGRNHLFGGPGHDVLNPNDGTPAGEDPPNPLADGENEYDVNLDGRVTAADALAIVNRLNEHGSGPVSDGAEWPGASVLLLDVDGSQTIEPADALQVVNYLNSPAASAGEGEADGEMVQTVPPTVGDQAAARLAIAGVPLAEFSVRQGAADDGQWTGLVEVRSGWGGQRRIAAGEAWFAADRVLAFQLEWPHERKPLSIKGFKAATDAGIWDSALDAMAADVDRVWNPRSERLSGPVGIE